VNRDYLIPAAVALFAAAAILLLALGCGDDRPLPMTDCNPGLDGGPAYCERTGGAVPSCKECPP
jgi:hypothetical protein